MRLKLTCRVLHKGVNKKKSHKEKHHTMKEKLVQWLEKWPITKRSVLPTALFNQTIAKSQLEVQENLQCSSIFFLQWGKLPRSVKTAAVAVHHSLFMSWLTNLTASTACSRSKKSLTAPGLFRHATFPPKISLGYFSCGPAGLQIGDCQTERLL